MPGMHFWFKKGAWARGKARRVIDAISAGDVRRVAVIRHAALGDMVLTRPFLVELRKAFPNAKITLSVVPAYQRGAPADLVDRIHILGTERNGRLQISIDDLRALGPQDLLFDLASTSRSRRLTLFTPARLKFGFPYRHGFLEKRLYDVMVMRSDLVFEAETCLHMLNLIGIETKAPPDFALPVSSNGRSRPYLVYFPGASHPGKCWPAARMAELVRRMAKRYPQRDHLVLGGLQPWESAEAITEQVQATNVQPVECRQLDDTITLVAHAELVVSNDTSIRHLAIAAGTATVGIFFAHGDEMPQVYRYLPRFGRHRAALAGDGTPPAVDIVQNACQTLMRNGPD